MMGESEAGRGGRGELGCEQKVHGPRQGLCLQTQSIAASWVLESYCWEVGSDLHQI